MNQNNSFLFLANDDRISVYIHCQNNVGFAYDIVTFGCDCDYDNGYELFGDNTCGICNLEGCLECYNALTCQLCDENNTYFLNPSDQC